MSHSDGGLPGFEFSHATAFRSGEQGSAALAAGSNAGAAATGKSAATRANASGAATRWSAFSVRPAAESDM